MVGTQVFVEDESGDIFKGLLRGFSAVDQLEVELVSVYKVIFVSESKFSLTRLGKNETMKVVATRISGDSEPGNARTFRTDSKIAATKNLNNGGNEHLDMSDTELDLQEWEDDGCGEYGAIESINCVVDELDSLGGWSVTDMFQANKDKCVGNGTVFDESEFSNVGIGEHSKEVLEKAQALAQQISMNPASRHNAQLENDDEERDLDAATKFDANEKSQRGGGKFNDERKQRQVMDKVSLSATKMIEYKKDDGKYEKKPFTSEKKIHSQKVMTSELNDVRKGGNKKFEKEKKVDAVDVSPPPEPLPPQNVKAPTPIQSRKNSAGGRASVDRAVSVQSSEQGDKGERKFKLDLNAPSFVPSSKPSTKVAESTTIINSNNNNNNNNVSSAPTPMISNNSLVVYNNNTIGTTTSTNNLATIATNFGNNFVTNQVATFVPVPAASLQQFQYAQLQHQPPIAQAQVPLTHQPMLTNHNLSQSPSVQPQQQHVQQVTIPATVHQQQHIFQQQQQAAGFYATGTDSANLSGYVLNWGATAGNNFMANQVTTFAPVPAASLQQFQYAQLPHQPPIAQTQPPPTHHTMPPNHTLSRSPSVQAQQQHVQQVTIPATVHQQHLFQQQQQAAGFYASTGTDATNLSGYVLNWGAPAGNNFMTNQVATFVPIPAAALQQFQYAQLQHQPPIPHSQPPLPHQPPPTHTLSRSSSVQPQQHAQQTNMQVATAHQPQQQRYFQIKYPN
ncbi:unnamed protein product [Meloidogyne enterolobii]|uniref:Uncharacterized protein n=1 Tax=Meloidogyne enterolobii TaxID=390850 RepID=A0ACB0ZI10_MELEN